MKEWRLLIDHSEDTVIFRDKRVELEENEKGHLMVKLELVKKWEEKDVIYSVEKENEVKCDKAEKKIQSVTVIEQENDKGKMEEKVNENLCIKKFNEDMSGEVLMENENDENEIGPERNVNLEEMIKGKN